MIKVDEIFVETEGSVVNILSELAVAVRAIGYKKGYLTKEKMHELVDQAYKTDDEIHKEAMEILKEKSESLNNLMKLLEKKTCEICPKKDTCEKRESCKENDTNDSSNKEEEVLKKIFRDILRDDK